MTQHIIFKNEITSCQVAAGALLSDEGDPRSNFQMIFHILEGCKDRFLPRDDPNEISEKNDIDYLRDQPLDLLKNAPVISYNHDPDRKPEIADITIRYHGIDYCFKISEITKTPMVKR